MHTKLYHATKCVESDFSAVSVTKCCAARQKENMTNILQGLQNNASDSCIPMILPSKLMHFSHIFETLKVRFEKAQSSAFHCNFLSDYFVTTQYPISELLFGNLEIIFGTDHCTVYYNTGSGHGSPEYSPII